MDLSPRKSLHSQRGLEVILPVEQQMSLAYHFSDLSINQQLSYTSKNTIDITIVMSSIPNNETWS